MAFWNEEIETMPREELEKMQLRLLKEKITEMYAKSKFFKKRMDEAGLKPEDINSFEDFRKVPFMKKTDLRDNYPDGLFVVPYDDIIRVHVSSGTTGKPTVVGYTQKDLDNWTEALARGMTSFGLTKKDMVQNMHGYGLFTGGLVQPYFRSAQVTPTGRSSSCRTFLSPHWPEHPHTTSISQMSAIRWVSISGRIPRSGRESQEENPGRRA